MSLPLDHVDTLCVLGLTGHNWCSGALTITVRVVVDVVSVLVATAELIVAACRYLTSSST